jgi:hypothetical protein
VFLFPNWHSHILSVVAGHFWCICLLVLLASVTVFFRSFGVCSALQPIRSIVPLPLKLPSFTTRGAVYQPDTQRTLLAEEGTITISSTISEFTKIVEFFYMPQSWDMGQIILLPVRRKACCGFFQPEKSDGFGRARTRDLGYQRPAC